MTHEFRQNATKHSIYVVWHMTIFHRNFPTPRKHRGRVSISNLKHPTQSNTVVIKGPPTKGGIDSGIPETPWGASINNYFNDAT